MQGFWNSRENRVLLVNRVVDDGALVRHEMLHALLGATGHPRAAFLGGCADVVACAGQCAREAGGAIVRDSAAPVRDSGAVEVTTLVVPDGVVRPAGERTWVTVTVSVHNPAPAAVRVRVPSPTGGGPARGGVFGYYGEGLGGGAVVGGPLVAFGPGETRRETFDVVVEPGAAGERSYAVVGRFADHRSSPAPLVVRRDTTRAGAAALRPRRGAAPLLTTRASGDLESRQSGLSSHRRLVSTSRG